MTDFLKQNPSVTREEYMWDWTIPQILLSTYDFTHTEYLSEEEAEKRNATHFDSPEDLVSAIGIPSF